MSIFEGTVEAVSVKPSKYDEGNFSHGYKINDSWYNIDSTTEEKMAGRGDKVKVEAEGKELVRLKVIAKGEPPSLNKDGKPAYKAKGSFAGRAPYKKPVAEVVSMAISTAMKCASDISISLGNASVESVSAKTEQLARMIVSAHGEEAVALVKASFGEIVAKTATNVATKATSVDKRLTAQKKSPPIVENEEQFDDDIPF